MRWLMVTGVALSSFIAGGALMSRAFGPTSEPPAPPASEPDSVHSSAAAEDPGSPSPASSSDSLPVGAAPGAADDGLSGSAEDPRALQAGLDQAMHAMHAAQENGGRDEPRGPRPAAPPPANADIALDPAGLGPEAEALAQKLGPGLAREALAGEKPPGTPEVERELLQTWKEQKQILSGERDTIDSVLNAAH